MWNPLRGWPLFAWIAATAAMVDLVTKTAIFDRLGMPGIRRGIVLVPGMLSLETNLNEGALFGMGQGLGMLFSLISGLAIAGIAYVVSRPSNRDDIGMILALGLIAGGIVGNLYDRLGLPHLVWHAPLGRVGQPVYAVRDWIHFRLEGLIDWPIFNLADTWLVIGAGLLFLLSLRPPGDGADVSGTGSTSGGTFQ